jgi:hypothetical protein
VTQKKPALPFRRGDAILSLALIVCAIGIAVGLAMQPPPEEAVVAVAGETPLRYALRAEAPATSLPVDAGGYHLLIQIDGLRARILQSDCPDQVCVRTGWLTRAGQAAVCVPARVTLRMEGRHGDVDAVLR